MEALFRCVLHSGIIFLISCSNVFAAAIQSEMSELSGPRFSVEHSAEYHPRFYGLLTLSLMNATQNSLSDIESLQW